MSAESAQRLLTVPAVRKVIDADYGVLDEAARRFASIHELEAEPFLIAVVSAIPKVRSAGGALVRAVEQARQSPLVPCPPIHRLGRTFELVTSTAYWLQDYASEKPITLPRNALGLAPRRLRPLRLTSTDHKLTMSHRALSTLRTIHRRGRVSAFRYLRGLDWSRVTHPRGLEVHYRRVVRP